MPPRSKGKKESTKAPSRWLMYAVLGNGTLERRLTEKKSDNLGTIRGCSFMLADPSAPETSLLGADHYIFDVGAQCSSALTSEKVQASMIKHGQTWYDQKEGTHSEFYEAHFSMPKKSRNGLIEGRKICVENYA